MERWIAGENLEDLLENNTGNTGTNNGINNTNNTSNNTNNNTNSNTNSNTGSTGNNGNTDPSLENYFTQYITFFYSPLGEQSVDNPIPSGDIPYTDGLVGGWKEQNSLTDKPTKNKKQTNHPPTHPPNRPPKKQQTYNQIQPSITTQTLYGGGLKDSGFRREARIMAILLGYGREQMPRAVVDIARCISYFYQKTYNMEEAIYRTFAVYLYLSEKVAGKKVFIHPEVISRFEEESMQSEISNIAWGYLERYKEKQEKQKQKEKQKQQRQKRKQKHKQRNLF
jgi:hypothetical protein